MRALINGRDIIDESEYLEYINDDIIDIEIAKHNIGRFIYKYMIDKTPGNIFRGTSFLLETINDELYKRALLMKSNDNINYIRILANRISTLLSLHGDSRYSFRSLVDFLYDQIR